MQHKRKQIARKFWNSDLFFFQFQGLNFIGKIQMIIKENTILKNETLIILYIFKII